MFKTFFLSEIKSALRQPMIYIFMSLIALLVFGATVSDNVQIGGAVGNVHKNAPHILTIYTTIMTIFGLLIATAFFNNAALRDYNNEFNEILFTTPLSKSGYFFGRFIGALILSTIPMLGVFIGNIIGSALAPVFGWVAADRFGDLYWSAIFNNYFLFILPNMFFAGSIIFAVANKWKSTIISFVGTLVIIIGYIVAGTLMSDMDNETLAALTDVFGIRAYSIYAKYYTPIEKNTLVPGFSGIVLYNRIIWLSAGVIIILTSYFSFSFKEKNKKVRADKSDNNDAGKSFTLPETQKVFGNYTTWLQFKSFFVTNFISISKSVTFIILFLFSAIILIANLIGGFEYFGLQSYPVTYKIIDLIRDATIIYVVIILVFFSGELIWRDRESKINEVIDSTPYTSFISLFAKALSLVCVTSMLHLFLIICGVLYQLVMGYTRIELGVYLLDFFYNNLILFFTWSGVMIFIQILVNNKYVAYFISIAIVFIWSIIMEIMDIESNMLSIASGPSLQYSDMNGFGPALTGAMWFNIYWVLFAFICLMLAGAIWVRGTRNSLKERISIAMKSTPKAYKITILISSVLWLAVGVNVYYNTQLLNKYLTADEREELMVDYEKKYKKYETLALPKIGDTKYKIDIYPEERNLEIEEEFFLINENNIAIDTIIINVDKDWNTELILPGSEIVFEDDDHDIKFYKMNPILKPGDSVKMRVLKSLITEGFSNERTNTFIVNNGTFFNNAQILPGIGYNSGAELSDNNDRKKYGLPEKRRMPKLEYPCENCEANYLSSGLSDFINVETFISTSEDQIAIAPGSLIKQWNENGRNYYQYKVDHSSLNFYSFISAKYEIAKRAWNGIDIEVYYDKKHPENVEMMLDAVERALTYYTKNFGPYYHKQCRIIEFPRYAQFAQAFPGTMPYSESIGFIIDLEDSTENNVVDWVVAHEMAHQYWAHQVIGAEMQGGTLLSESFAEYSSLMTLKNLLNDPMRIREFVKYDHDRYLKGRTTETEHELPLYKVENQGHIHYGKGSVIMYALQDYIGEEKVNTALKNFLDKHKYIGPPYPTSMDFLVELDSVVPDSLKYLIDDWFKKITLYDLRLKEATYTKRDDGKYEVQMQIESSKIYADSIGNENKVAINDWVDIGLFGDSDEKDLMYVKRVKFNQPEMTFNIVVDELPEKAAIDPKRLLIERVYKDNIKAVSEK